MFIPAEKSRKTYDVNDYLYDFNEHLALCKQYDSDYERNALYCYTSMRPQCRWDRIRDTLNFVTKDTTKLVNEID